MAKIKIVASKLPKIKIKKPNFNFSKINIKDYKKYIKPVAIGLGILIAFILIDLFVQYLNNDYSIAVVNGTRISRDAYHKKLETLYGQTIAAQMIDEEIIKQEAKKANVSATKNEIQEKLDAIISDVGGQEAYESVLKANGIEEKTLRDQLELNIITRKIMEPTLEYSDDDVKAFFDQYSGVIFPNETAALEEGAKLDYEQYKDETKEYFIQQEIEKEKSTWIGGLYSEYKIQDNSTEKPTYGVLKTTINIFKNLFTEINSNEK